MFSRTSAGSRSSAWLSKTPGCSFVDVDGILMLRVNFTDTHTNTHFSVVWLGCQVPNPHAHTHHILLLLLCCCVTAPSSETLTLILLFQHFLTTTCDNPLSFSLTDTEGETILENCVSLHFCSIQLVVIWAHTTLSLPLLFLLPMLALLSLSLSAALPPPPSSSSSKTVLLFSFPHCTQQ